MARPLKRCGACPLRTVRAADVCVGCEMYSPSTNAFGWTVIGRQERGRLRRYARKQVVRAFRDISVQQCIIITDGLVHLAGYYRAGVKLHEFGQQKRGPKKNLHLFHAVADCCRLWSEATGRDWRKVNTRGMVRDREAIVSNHPPIILARILIRSATSKPRVSSLDHVFRELVGFSELPHCS